MPSITGGRIIHLQSNLRYTDIYSAQLAAVLGISLGVKRNVLTFSQRLEAITHDSRKMYEYVISAVIVCEEAIAFVCIKPFYCTVIHFGYLH